MSWAKYAGFHFATYQGLNPAAITTATNGYVIDRLTYQHALMVLSIGAVTGTGVSLDVKVQDSADGSTGWADYTPPTLYDSNDQTVTTAKFPTFSSAGARKLDVDLGGAKRYIRLVATAGGGNPSFTASAIVLLDQRDGNMPGATG